jgi:acyl-CoA thioester hydrolase
VSTSSGTFRGRVEWIDTDAAGIYHNTSVVRYVEAAEAELMRRLGLDGYFPSSPRVRYEVSFEAPLRFGDPVVAVVRVAEVGRTSMTFEFEVWRDGADAPQLRAARGSYITVHLSGEDARPTPWPPDWVDALRGVDSPARPVPDVET